MRDDDPAARALAGRQHPALRRLRALRRDPALRRREAVLVAEGVRLAQEALRAGAPIELAVAAPALLADAAGARLWAALGERAKATLVTAESVLAALQDARSPQPLVTLVSHAAPSVEDVLDAPAPAPLVVVCDGIQDPGNLGTVLRTAEAAGATGVIACGRGVDPTHPRLVRASAGAVLRLPAATGDAATVAEALAARGLAVVVTDAHVGQPHWTLDYRAALALVLGSETGTLAPALRARATATVHVPMQAGVESLSVGAAAAVVLFEAAAQRAGVRAPVSSACGG